MIFFLSCLFRLWRGHYIYTENMVFRILQLEKTIS